MTRIGAYCLTTSG